MLKYDCLGYAGRPPSAQPEWIDPSPGCLPALVDGQRFYAIKPNTGGARDLTTFSPTEAAKWSALAPPNAPRILDIESRQDPIYRELATDVRLYPGREAVDDADFLIAAINAVKAHNNGGPVAIYDMFPNSFNVFNLVLLSDKPALRLWRGANDFLASTGLIDVIDAFCPSFYTVSSSVPAWTAHASTVVRECRRLHPTKPIIPFISPNRHPSAGGDFIPVAFWKRQLLVLDQLDCAGVVLWKGNDTPEPWSAAAPYIEVLA